MNKTREDKIFSGELHAAPRPGEARSGAQAIFPPTLSVCVHLESWGRNQSGHSPRQRAIPG